MKKISLVTGTVNRLELLKRLVRSVRDSVEELPYEIVVVDNNSTDGTRAWLTAQYDVKYLNIGEPQGSVAAFQLGYTSCSPDSSYVVTLNDDIALEGATLINAYNYLEAHPEVGQVAFGHRYQNREALDPGKPVIQTSFGYTYAQCGMTRKWLGDIVDWCGPDEGYTHYAWDTRLSMAIWRLGYRVDRVEGCSVIDWEHDDDIRQQFSADMRDGQGRHPDTQRFYQQWSNRLPEPSKWSPSMSPTRRLLNKIANNTCRVLRFKAMMAARDKMRTACIDALAAWGPTKQINQDAIIRAVGLQQFQRRAVDLVHQYGPDFVMMQAQRPNNILPGTIEHMRKTFSNTFFFNWDGDTHYPLTEFHFQVARASHLQGLISPTYFPEYIARGCPNVCYWPIAVEKEFLAVRRDPEDLPGPDVLFLGSLYGEGKFPEATTRRESVAALHRHPSIDLKVYGHGWNKVGIRATSTLEQFDTNPQRYAKAKMALSVSQTKDFWGYSSDRLYNITATGCPPLVQRFVGMDEHGYVDGETCIAWETIPEMLDKVQYYLHHADERERIGAAVKKMVLSRHTWTHRVRGLLAMLEGMEYHRYEAP
jgi:glycosyltransferase involved in cell wall biosynthesis